VEKGKISTALVNPTEDHDKRRVTGLLLREVASAITVTVETLQTSDLPDGDVTVGVEYSDVHGDHRHQSSSHRDFPSFPASISPVLLRTHDRRDSRPVFMPRL